MSAPAWLAAQCGCGCRPAGLAPGCPCPECQPGPGIDHTAGRSAKSKQRAARLRHLLQKPEDELSPDEVAELDGLLHWTIHRM